MRHFTFRALTAALGCAALVACSEDPRVGATKVSQQPAAVPEGHAIEIRRVLIGSGSGGTSTVTAVFSVTDSGAPVAEADLESLRPSWTLAGLETEPVTGAPAWRSYVLTGAPIAQLPVAGPTTPPELVLTATRQPGAESDGTLVDLGGGAYTYRFTATLPATIDRNETLRVGVYLAGAVGTERTTATFDFVPSNGAVATRELVLESGCRSCHAAVRSPDGLKTGAQICVTCHTFQHADPETVDPAAAITATAATNPNPLEFGRLVHRIHRGKSLPTLYTSPSTAPPPALPGTTGTTFPLPWSTSRGVATVGRRFSVVGALGKERVFGEVVNRTDNYQVAKTVAFGVTFPRDLRSCDVCHPPEAKSASVVHTEISRRSCGSCHPDVWFESGTPDVHHFPHTGGEQADDTKCAGCHVQSDGTSKVYAKLSDLHVAPGKSPRFNKPTVEIVSVENLKPGQSPIITFTLSDRNGPIESLGAPTPANDGNDPPSPVLRRFTSVAPPALHDLTKNSGVSISLLQRSAGAVDFGSGFAHGTEPYLSESIPLCDSMLDPLPAPTDPCVLKVANVSVGVAPNQRLAFRYQMKKTLPATANGTWLVSMSASRSITPTFYDANTDTFAWPYTGASVSEAADNALAYVDVAEGTYPGGATPRREVVAVEKCNNCHLRLSGHGGSRNAVALCVACHTYDRTDWESRPKVKLDGTFVTYGAGGTVALSKTYDGIEERSLHFKRLIHRIHTGGHRGPAELATVWPFTSYRNGSARFRDRGEFPGNLANCLTCHLEGTFLIESIPEGAAPTLANETGTLLHVPPAVQPAPPDPPVEASDEHPEHEEGVNAIVGACLDCHATSYAEYHVAKHAPEDCAGCHGANATTSVRKVHGVPAPPATTATP